MAEVRGWSGKVRKPLPPNPKTHARGESSRSYCPLSLVSPKLTFLRRALLEVVSERVVREEVIQVLHGLVVRHVVLAIQSLIAALVPAVAVPADLVRIRELVVGTAH